MHHLTDLNIVWEFTYLSTFRRIKCRWLSPKTNILKQLCVLYLRIPEKYKLSVACISQLYKSIIISGQTKSPGTITH